MSDQIMYCRIALPEGGGRQGNILATKHAITEVLSIMERTPTNPAGGTFRITYDMDSHLERECVVAEWRPNK